MKSAAPLVGTPKAVWLARNFVWWSRWEGEGKGLAGACIFVVRVRAGMRGEVVAQGQKKHLVLAHMVSWLRVRG